MLSFLLLIFSISALCYGAEALMASGNRISTVNVLFTAVRIRITAPGIPSNADTSLTL